MSEYRTTATLTSEGTFVIPEPDSLPAGTEAEVIVRYADVPAAPTKTFAEFFKMLDESPPQRSTAEEEQAFLRVLRNEWD